MLGRRSAKGWALSLTRIVSQYGVAVVHRAAASGSSLRRLNVSTLDTLASGLRDSSYFVVGSEDSQSVARILQSYCQFAGLVPQGLPRTDTIAQACQPLKIAFRLIQNIDEFRELNYDVVPRGRMLQYRSRLSELT